MMRTLSIHKACIAILSIAIALSIQPCAQAVDYYVARAGQTPTSPYGSWGDAASNIAAAVGLAGGNDTVWVSNATYTIDAQIDVGAGVMVRSYNNGALDRDGTIVKGSFPSATNRCFYIHNADAVVRGFTITNGYVSAGNGGGVYLTAGRLEDCLVTGNVSTNNGNGGGGGVYMSGANSVVSNCDIIGNATYGGSHATGGGGVKMANASQVWNSRIMYNNSPIYWTGGGGIHCHDDTVVANSMIISNRIGADYNTGGSGSSSEYAWGGGGIWIHGDNIVLRNCVIAGNGRGNADRGIGVGGDSGTSATIENCTVVHNVGSGIGALDSKSPTYTVRNTVSFFNDYAARDMYAGAGTLIASNSCMSSTNHVDIGSGNITVAPAFVDRDRSDYRLHPWSPGVDAGLVQSWMSSAEDLDGSDRIGGNGRVDMGAYETTAAGAPTHYVAQDDQTPVSPYTSWGTAASNLHDAVAAAYDGTTIRIKSGTYLLTNQVVVGYNTLRSDDGSGNLDRDGTIINGNYPSVTNRCFTLTLRDGKLEGLTITNGYVDGSGGGVYMQAGTINNCLITGNTATNTVNGNGGGGVYIEGAGCIVTNCDIVANIADCPSQPSTGGGGIFLNAGGEVWNSRIMRNQNRLYWSAGGGVNAAGGALYNCSIISNSAGASSGGGGVWSRSQNVLIRNCLVMGNHEGTRLQRGGGIGTWRTGATVENCTVVSNTGTGIGGSSSDGYTMHVRNTIAYYNSKSDMYTGTVATVIASNSCTPADSHITSGSGNITNAPGFADLLGGDFRLTAASDCIDAALEFPWMADALDLDGNPRISASAPDIGAYEYRIYGTLITIQ